MAVNEKLRKKLEKRKQQLADKGKGMGYEQFKEGKKTMRIVQVGEDNDFAIEVEHFYLSKELGGYISPRTFGGVDPGYDAYDRLKKSKDEGDQSVAATFKPRKMYLTAGLISKDSSGKEWDFDKGLDKKYKGVTLIKITGGMYSELIEWMLDEDAGDFTDQKEGYAIKVTRVGTGQFDTEYTLMSLAGKKIGVIPKEILKHQFDLEEMVKAITPTEEQIQEKIDSFLGASMDDDDDEPKKKKKKKGKIEDKKDRLKEGKKKKKKKTSDI